MYQCVQIRHNTIKTIAQELFQSTSCLVFLVVGVGTSVENMSENVSLWVTRSDESVSEGMRVCVCVLVSCRRVSGTAGRGGGYQGTAGVVRRTEIRGRPVLDRRSKVRPTSLRARHLRMYDLYNYSVAQKNMPLHF